MVIFAEITFSLGIFFTTFGRILKKQETNLYFNAISNLFFCVFYLILSNASHMLISLVGVIRSLVCFTVLEFGLEKKKIIPFSTLVLYTLLCIVISNNLLLSFFLIARGITYIYGALQKDKKVFKIMNISSSLLSIVYNFLVFDYSMAVWDILVIIVVAFTW